MVRFATNVRVERPPEDVFAYLSDPSNLSEWQGTAEVEQLTPGPVRAGTRFREVHVVAGRRNEQVTEVDEFDPPHRFGVRVVQGPLRVDGRWDLSAIDGGTLLTLRAQGRGPTGDAVRRAPDRADPRGTLQGKSQEAQAGGRTYWVARRRGAAGRPA